MPSPAERPIAVYKFHPVVWGLSFFAALLLQAFLPLVIPLARLFDFPLLVTIYFSLVRRNRIFGTLVGTVAGLLQDALSHGYLGMFGMAKALAGYIAAWASVKFDLEQMLARLLLAASLVLIHNLMMFALRFLLIESAPLEPLDLASAVLVNTALAVVLFSALDRLREPT
jgi:rod shape-determining protein MreD